MSYMDLEQHLPVQTSKQREVSPLHKTEHKKKVHENNSEQMRLSDLRKK